MTLSNNQK